jgi:hypothetical protein
MGEALRDEGAGDGGTAGAARRLARVVEPLHSITYYAPEIRQLADDGYRGWWHAYFAYRSAPLGAASAPVVTAVFYNFAPRMVERAVPSVWEVQPPEAVIERRRQLVAAALDRIFGGGEHDASIRAAAELARRAAEGCAVAGRPLYAAYTQLPWPDEPALALWHACTLLREYRFDGHNIALAAAGLDGVECHVLMAARGHGNKPTILAIRGWNDAEWEGAVERLAARGWVTPGGEHTDDGRAGRSAVERHTDVLASEPVRRLGDDGIEALVSHLEPLVAHLVGSGEVAGQWPPRHLIKPAAQAGAAEPQEPAAQAGAAEPAGGT